MISSDQHWIREVFTEATAKPLCLIVGCTTCGGWPFEMLLLQSAASVQGVRPGLRPHGRAPIFRSLEQAGVMGTLKSALAGLTDADLSRYHAPLRLLVCRPSLFLGNDGGLVQPLAGTPFGYLVLTTAQAHREQDRRRAQRDIERREQDDLMREAQRVRKQAEAEVRKIAHGERLVAKTAKDALWRQTQTAAGKTLETREAVFARRELRKERRRAARSLGDATVTST